MSATTTTKTIIYGDKNASVTKAAIRERYYVGQNLLANTTRADYELTHETGMEKYDYKVTINGKVYRVEVKVRNLRHNQYAGAMIERDKYDALMEAYNTTGEIPLYQCFYQDGYYLLFDLRKHTNLTNQVKNCNKTTAYYSGKKDKNTYDLPITDALKRPYVQTDEARIERYFNAFYTVVS